MSRRWYSNRFAFSFILALVAAGAAEGQEKKRYALVIGNSAYQHVGALANPSNDARDLTVRLRSLGFEVDERVDADQRTMEQAADAFVGRLTPGCTALFHYSGHGMQIEQENYLIPVDFELTDEASVKYDAVSASKLHERVAKSGARLNIMVFDACRNNNFSLSRSGGSGLAAMNAARGSFVAFATAPGKTADDNRRGSNGLFTGFLLEALSTPGLKLDEVFNRVRERTFAASGERQLPWTSSSVIGDFYFIPDGTERDLTFVPNDAEVVPVASTPAPPQPRQGGPTGLDLRFSSLIPRTAAVRQSLDQLRATQSARGMGLRGDMAAAAAQLDYNLEVAESNLSDDPGAAKRHLDLAERALEKLEKFLGM